MNSFLKNFRAKNIPHHKKREKGGEDRHKILDRYIIFKYIDF